MSYNLHITVCHVCSIEQCLRSHPLCQVISCIYGKVKSPDVVNLDIHSSANQDILGAECTVNNLTQKIIIVVHTYMTPSKHKTIINKCELTFLSARNRMPLAILVAMFSKSLEHSCRAGGW